MGKKKDTHTRQQKKSQQRKAESLTLESTQPHESNFTQAIQKTTKNILYSVFVAPILLLLSPVFSLILWIKNIFGSETEPIAETDNKTEQTEESKEETVEEVEAVTREETVFDAEDMENFKEEIRSKIREFMDTTNQKISGLEKQISSLKKQLKRGDRLQGDSNSLTPDRNSSGSGSGSSVVVPVKLPPLPPPLPMKPLFTNKPLVITKKGENANNSQPSQSSGKAKPAINLSEIISKRSNLRRSDSLMLPPVAGSPLRTEVIPLSHSFNKLKPSSHQPNSLNVTMSDLNSLSLKKVAIQRSPGGTPMRRDLVVQDVADTIPNMFSNALKRKFENARTPPKRSPLRSNNSPNRTPKKSPKTDSIKNSGKENSLSQSSPIKIDLLPNPNPSYCVSPVTLMR